MSPRTLQKQKESENDLNVNEEQFNQTKRNERIREGANQTRYNQFLIDKQAKGNIFGTIMSKEIKNIARDINEVVSSVMKNK